MITYVTLPEATANIVQLLDRVAQGEEIIISQAGKTIAHISPPPKVLEPRSPGQDAGQFIESCLTVNRFESLSIELPHIL